MTSKGGRIQWIFYLTAQSAPQKYASVIYEAWPEIYMKQYMAIPSLYILDSFVNVIWQPSNRAILLRYLLDGGIQYQECCKLAVNEAFVGL